MDQTKELGPRKESLIRPKQSLITSYPSPVTASHSCSARITVVIHGRYSLVIDQNAFRRQEEKASLNIAPVGDLAIFSKRFNVTAILGLMFSLQT